MNALKKKLNKNGGFTLVEMLIVVAIIAILVAVSIPLVNSALHKANDATDQANERAAKAVVTISLLDGEIPGGMPDATATVKNVYYNADSGELQEAAPTKKYGKCSEKHDDGDFVFSEAAGTGAKDEGNHSNKAIKITLTYDATSGKTSVVYTWE